MALERTESVQTIDGRLAIFAPCASERDHEFQTLLTPTHASERES